MRAITFLLFLAITHVAQADVTLEVSLSRTTYWRGETVRLPVRCTCDDPAEMENAFLRVTAGGLVSVSTAAPQPGKSGTITTTLTVPTRSLRSGQEYPVRIELLSGNLNNKSEGTDQPPIAAAKTHIFVVRKPNPERLDIWQWLYGGPSNQIHIESKTMADDLGFTVAGGPVFPYSPPGADPQKRLQDYRSSLEATMKRGMGISLCPVGIWYREYNLNLPSGSIPLVEPSAEGEHPTIHPDDDTRYRGASRNGHHYFNPFHPAVARAQTTANEMMMKELGDFPNLDYAFVDAEWVDDLRQHNANIGGLKAMQEKLGFGPDEIGSPKYVAPGVVADDDRGLRYRRYVYQHGNGVNIALKRAAEAVHRHRPDVKFLSDPFRSAALLDMYPGCDLISTWTYTNPDPKMMLYIETLRAACKPAGQEPLHVITLLNYPGRVVPEAHDKNWIMMGPGRLTETTWINLSRAPKVIGYYAFDSYYKSDLAFSPETLATLKELSQKVFVPFGPLLRKLNVAPRRIALLSSDSSRLYNNSPHLQGYPNYQPYHFYTVMSMAHLNADVVFDESIERYGLDDYDVLVLPKCDVLTQTVYDKVLAFQKRGGMVIADQYLGPDLPNVTKFDFDFTHRRKVDANAIASGKVYVGADDDDHIVPGKTKMENMTGVTALQDQQLMEHYAAQLRSSLKGKLEPDVWCDQHDVLVNVLEKSGVKYLVVVNDKRTYDERTGPFKAAMEQLVPQTVTVHLRRSMLGGGANPYDLLAHKSLAVTENDQELTFSVPLSEIGGTIVALAPQKIAGVKISSPESTLVDVRHTIRIQVVNSDNQPARGLHPLQVVVTDPKGNDTEYSHHACANDGRYEFSFSPAVNDPVGGWKIKVNDLTTGVTATTGINVLKN